MPSTTIDSVHAREVFDSRGRPTVEVEIRCEGHAPGRAMVPSGASTGAFEARELRDGDPQRLDGRGVRKAVQNVRTEIAAALKGLDADDQELIDRTLRELDGTADKSRLGANAILGCSLAAACATARALGIDDVDQYQRIWQPRVDRLTSIEATPTGQSPTFTTSHLGRHPALPLAMVNMISGGRHAGGQLDFQDYLILPVGATSWPQAFDWIVTVYYQLGRLLTERGHEGVLVGDEGGYGPKLATNEEALELVTQAIERAGLRLKEDVSIGLDVAATHFYHDGYYQLAATGNERLTSNDVISLLEQWVDRYPIISIEDALAEEDWPAWTELTRRIGNRVQVIGDDLFVTNVERLCKGIERGAANAVLVKLNQIGTLTETLDTLELALTHNYLPVISARSGETEDTTIADLVVATGAGQLKVGSVARSERLAKYNQLLRHAERPEFSYLGHIVLQK